MYFYAHTLHFLGECKCVGVYIFDISYADLFELILILLKIT